MTGQDWPGFRALDSFLVAMRFVLFLILFYVVGWLALVVLYFVLTDLVTSLVFVGVGGVVVWRIARRR